MIKQIRLVVIGETSTESAIVHIDDPEAVAKVQGLDTRIAADLQSLTGFCKAATQHFAGKDSVTINLENAKELFPA
jgi:hypothetical protein